jgi:hypothetical protein
MQTWWAFAGDVIAGYKFVLLGNKCDVGLCLQRGECNTDRPSARVPWAVESDMWQ